MWNIYIASSVPDTVLSILQIITYLILKKVL